MVEYKNYSLLPHNTFGVDALCQRYVLLESEAEAQAFLPTIAATPLLLLGGGSNLLLTGDVYGVVVRSGIKGITILADEDDVLLRCGSGEAWDSVAAYAVEHNLYGAENLAQIPGDVGATAVQNIGAYGVEIADIIHSVSAVDIATGQSITIPSAACEYAYRSSRFKTTWRNRYFITAVTYRLRRTFTPRTHYAALRQALAEQGIAHPTAAQVRQTVCTLRQEKLPAPEVLGSAGSFFMNPLVPRAQGEALQQTYPDIPVYPAATQTKLAAGWLIERCGWKGRTVGRVGTYEKNALVLVNHGGATGKEILAVAQRIQHDVAQRFGVTLKTEVNII